MERAMARSRAASGKERTGPAVRHPATAADATAAPAPMPRDSEVLPC